MWLFAVIYKKRKTQNLGKRNESDAKEKKITKWGKLILNALLTKLMKIISETKRVLGVLAPYLTTLTGPHKTYMGWHPLLT